MKRLYKFGLWVAFIGSPDLLWASFPSVSSRAVTLGPNRPESAVVLVNDEACTQSYEIRIDSPIGLQRSLRFSPRRTTLAPGQQQTVRLQLWRGTETRLDNQQAELVITKNNLCGVAPATPIRWAVAIPLTIE